MRNKSAISIASGFVAVAVILMASYTWAAQLVVTTLADSGPGSLRQAILDADANPSPDVITFAPGLAGLILLQSELPHLSGAPTPNNCDIDPNITTIHCANDTIDGTGAGVVIDGTELPPLMPGDRRTVLGAIRSGITIRGLNIQNVTSGEFIRVEATSATTYVKDVVIDGNILTGDPGCIGSITTTVVCPRGIFVNGGTGPNYKVEAAVTNNTTRITRTGILVFGNDNDHDQAQNTVTVVIAGNRVGQAKQGPLCDPDCHVAFGTGIGVMPGVGFFTGSHNHITATISNNTSTDNEADGIFVAACGSGSGASGEENVLNVTLTNNTVKDNMSKGIEITAATTVRNPPPPQPPCTNNDVTFEVSGNTVTGNGIVTLNNNLATNIDVHAGVGSGHHLRGSISNNTIKDSPAGDGIHVRGEGTQNSICYNTVCNLADLQFAGVTISGNVVTGNFNRGIIIQGGSNSVNAVLHVVDVVANTVKNNGSQGILVTGGTSSTNAMISDVLIDGNISTGNNRGIHVTRGNNVSTTFPPSISLAGITNNQASKNIGGDGILISANIPGSNTPISGNQANSNIVLPPPAVEDPATVNGIELRSTGYTVVNNTASSNAGYGIILGGNQNLGNTAKNNGVGNIAP